MPQEPVASPRKPLRKHYSDQDRANALAALKAHDGHIGRTAEATGIPPATLYLWAGVGHSRVRDLPVEVREQRLAPLEVREQAKRDLIGTLDQARWLYLDRLMEPDAVAKTSGYYAAVTTKILTEQHQLLSGGATARTELSLASFLGSTPLSIGGGVETNPERPGVETP